MTTPSEATVTEHVARASGRIASRVARGEIPSAKELFLLTAAVVERSHNKDRQALKLGLDNVVALLDGLPSEPAWDGCRGHLRATMEFAWLLLGSLQGLSHSAPSI